ncbi:MAG: glutathione S-transferase family protein [Pseudomonadota bacterium]
MTEQYTLHNRLGSGGFVVQAACAVANVPLAYTPLVSKPNESLGRLVEGVNDWGQVPVLSLADGSRITEVAAILAYLAHTEPAITHGPRLWIDNHPAFLRWSVFLAVNVYEGILRQSYTEQYVSRVDEIERTETQPRSGAVDALVMRSVRAGAKKRNHDAFRFLERETAGHRFLLSDRLSACDILLAMLYAWHNRKPDLPKCTWITEHVATHDIIRPIWKQNFHDRLDFKWHEL